jgi:2-(1,2-epoxy-1,2-dihydrophenyl)acetyl-CoA isomerase
MSPAPADTAAHAPARLAVSGGVATLTLANAAGMNAINKPATEAMLACLDDAEGRDDVRVLLTVAEGGAWCAGGDVATMAQIGEGAHDWIREVGEDVVVLVRRLHESRLLTVAGVSGAVAGGGVGLMGAHDVVLATDATSIMFAYSGLGLPPDAGGSYFAVRDLGYRRALDLYLTNARLDASAAAAAGLITRVVEDADAIAATARTLAAGPARAIAQTKRLMRQAGDGLLQRQLEDEIRTLADGTRDAEFLEGLAAFVERRRPDFPGAAG